MIRKNRRELNSYSPSKYLVCRKISKKLVRYYVHKLFFVDGGRAQIGKCTELGKTGISFKGFIMCLDLPGAAGVGLVGCVLSGCGEIGLSDLWHYEKAAT